MSSRRRQNQWNQFKQLVIDDLDDSDEEIIDMAPTGAHITGHTIAHKSSDGKKMQQTQMLVDEVNNKPILIIKKGSTEIKIHAEDWKFFNDRAIELLGKKRLVSKS